MNKNIRNKPPYQKIWGCYVVVTVGIYLFLIIYSGSFNQSLGYKGNLAYFFGQWLGVFLLGIIIGSIVFGIWYAFKGRKLKIEGEVIVEAAQEVQPTKLDIDTNKNQGAINLEKNKKWGLITFSLLSILTGISAVISNLHSLFTPMPYQVAQSLKYSSDLWWVASSSFSLAIGICSIFIGYHLMKQKELWRKIAIINCFVVLWYWLFFVLFISRYPASALLGSFPFFDVALLFYLTRPKVVNLFNIVEIKK